MGNLREIIAAGKERGAAQQAQQGAFGRSVQALLDKIEYRRCESGEDLEAIYRLRYKAYRAHGIVGQLEAEAMFDDLDDTPNCHRFGVFIDDELASTVRLHHVTAEHPYSPAMTIFGDLLMPRLARGESFIDPSRLAADPELVRLYRPLPYLTLRLAVIASAYFNATSCLSMIRDEHAAFYQRIFGSVQVGAPRPYPSVTVMAILFESRCALNMQKTLERFPFFRSTPMEQRMLFAKAAPGDLAPLTVLPTARFFRDAA